MGGDSPHSWRAHPRGAGDTRADTTWSGGNGQPRGYFRGVAPVPLRAGSGARDGGGDRDTDELPVVTDRPAPPRSRWSSLRRGGGWTMAGLWFAVICWGVWALVDRDLVAAGYALGLVLAIAALVFTVSRLLGRVVLENTFGRSRPSAWPSHLSTFVLLVISGLAFLQQTSWVMQAWSWFNDRLT